MYSYSILVNTNINIWLVEVGRSSIEIGLASDRAAALVTAVVPFVVFAVLDGAVDVELGELVHRGAVLERDDLDGRAVEALEDVESFAHVAVGEQVLGQIWDRYVEEKAEQHAGRAERKELHLILVVVEGKLQVRRYEEHRLAAKQAQQDAAPVGHHRAVRVRVLQVDNAEELREQHHVHQVWAQEPQAVHGLDRQRH